jgi:hypothetical protein
MVAKLRILTRRFDLAVEGDNVDEVERLLGVAEKRGFYPRASDATGGPISAVLQNDAQGSATTEFHGSAELQGPAVSTLDQFGGPVTVSSVIAPEVRAVTKRSDDVIVLSPKFPPAPDGAERVEAAAMVILAGYDAANEAPITGSRLVKSLRNTGYHIERVDRALDDLRQKGLIMVSGMRRGRTYQLSEAGKTEARKLAGELAALTGFSARTEGGTGQ